MEVFKSSRIRSNIVLNYNPHPGDRAEPFICYTPLIEKVQSPKSSIICLILTHIDAILSILESKSISDLHQWEAIKEIICKI